VSGRLLLAIQLAAILMLPASADDLNEVVAMLKKKEKRR
jgi:hypothetical protein